MYFYVKDVPQVSLCIKHPFNCLLMQRANQPITWQQFSEFMHADIFSIRDENL